MDKDEHGSGKSHPLVGSGVESLEAALEAELGGHPDKLVGLILENRYRIVDRIDSGGIGVVYRAEQLQLKRQVAIKVLHPKFAQNAEYRARFEREAQAAGKATHPSCIAVLDYGFIEDRPYLVMEYVEGPLLTDMIAQGEIALQDVVSIGLQLLEALRHAHRHDIVHRDVKPDNVMLTHPDEAGTQIKLLDFGLAKNLQPEAAEDGLVTRDGTVCGTPSYMSPEQAIAGKIDGRSDLYSCGVVLYQMATGRKPFLYDDMMQLIKAHLTETPLSPRELRPEISPELQDVLMLALQKKRKDRFQSAEEFIEALRAVPEAADLGGVETGTSQVAASVRVRERLSGATSAASAASVGTAATMQAPGERSGLTFDDEPLDRSMTTRARTGPQVLALLFFAVVVSVGTTYLLARYYPVADAGAPRVDSVAQLIESGRLSEAERRVRKAIASKPDDGRQHLLLGHIYSRKLWRKDALKEYRRAIERAPELRSDPTLLRNVIGFLGKDTAVPRTTRFLRQTVGAAAVPALKQASAEHTDPRVRRRAARALQRIEGATE